VKAARPARSRLVAIAGAVGFVALLVQAAIVTDARPQELLTGVHGMADLLRRSFPPNVSIWTQAFRPALETLDTALLGTVAGAVFAVPLAALAARNTAPSPVMYHAARASIALFRAIPDLVWALLFVTAVGLGAFPGVLALSVHSIGMLGRLFAEVIEDMDMGPVEALSLTGAGRMAVFTHAVVPGVAPTLLGIALYRLDENIRSSIVLGFVGAGGIGFQLLSAMNLFQYHDVSFYLIVNFALVVAAERVSAALRKRVL
jgi:phosphonate transport system permease protein